MTSRDRADRVLVARGLFSTRAQAAAAIEAGGVIADGETLKKPAQKIALDADIKAEPAHPWVSRAGLKLEAALDAFGLDVTGLECLDIGASTGGFIDVLLTRGAARITGVDVGSGQLASKLAANASVISLENLDARALTSNHLPAAPDLITCDASFIGLAKVLPAALALAKPDAALVTLFKPQFEVGPKEVGKGGVVKNDEAIARAFIDAQTFIETEGWRFIDTIDSPIRGGDGNLERLIYARKAPAQRQKENARR